MTTIVLCTVLLCGYHARILSLMRNKHHEQQQQHLGTYGMNTDKILGDAEPDSEPRFETPYARVVQKQVRRMQTKWQSSASDRINGVIVVMTTADDNDVKPLRMLLLQLEHHRLHYDIAIFHESDFDESLMSSLQSEVPSSDLIFVEIEFELDLRQIRDGFGSGNLTTVRHRVPNIEHPERQHVHQHGLKTFKRKHRPMGYEHMCRFFAGAGFELPFFDAYEWYWRLDTDSSCPAQMSDAFDVMSRTEGAEYGYNLEAGDGGDVVEGLWNAAVQFIDENDIEPTFMYKSNIFKAWGERNEFSVVPMFYTNFEVARLSLLRSDHYMKWFKFVDATQNQFLHRWGDAPIRWLGLSMFLEREHVVLVHNACTHP